MLRELLKYVPVVPLMAALLLFAVMPFDTASTERPEDDAGNCSSATKP